MGFRDNSHVHKEVYMGCNVESFIFKVYVSIIYSKSRTYMGFLNSTHVYIKNIILMVFLGIFRLWCLLESFS